ncbi:hypothetical protein LTR17_007131 [Elasticomyces elasticus]|nr:hypothetical protein LTR17_007131 [Elasticomyces elasticus]
MDHPNPGRLVNWRAKGRINERPNARINERPNGRINEHDNLWSGDLTIICERDEFRIPRKSIPKYFPDAKVTQGSNGLSNSLRYESYFDVRTVFRTVEFIRTREYPLKLAWVPTHEIHRAISNGQESKHHSVLPTTSDIAALPHWYARFRWREPYYPHVFTKNDILIIHAQMYEIGAMYELTGLRDRAQRNLIEAAEGPLEAHRFEDVVEAVITLGSDIDGGLQKALVNIVSDHSRDLLAWNHALTNTTRHDQLTVFQAQCMQSVTGRKEWYKQLLKEKESELVESEQRRKTEQARSLQLERLKNILQPCTQCGEDQPAPREAARRTGLQVAGGSTGSYHVEVTRDAQGWFNVRCFRCGYCWSHS